MRTIYLHPNDHTVLENATQIIRILFDNEILQFFGQSSSQESLCKNQIIFGNRNIILRHVCITNSTVSKLNQFIEPKTTFAAFLSEGMKEKQACRNVVKNECFFKKPSVMKTQILISVPSNLYISPTLKLNPNFPMQKR